MTDFNGLTNKRKTGAHYEQLAAAYLEREGYLIVGRNVRTRYGEIDLTARTPDRKTLVICEVKYRSSRDVSDALSAVDYRKQQQLIRMARQYMMKYRIGEETQVRFDVIGISGGGELSHIENAFDAGS